MLENLEFFKMEALKVKKTLEETNPRDYKRYATLYQTYTTLVNNIAQLEMMKKQQEEEEKNKKLDDEAYKRIEKSMKEDKVYINAEDNELK